MGLIDEEVKKRIKAGEDVASIVSALGCSKWTVYRARTNLKKEEFNLIDGRTGKTQAEIDFIKKAGGYIEAETEIKSMPSVREIHKSHTGVIEKPISKPLYQLPANPTWLDKAIYGLDRFNRFTDTPQGEAMLVKIIAVGVVGISKLISGLQNRSQDQGHTQIAGDWGRENPTILLSQTYAVDITKVNYVIAGGGRDPRTNLWR